jgi:hypothetical protein
MRKNHHHKKSDKKTPVMPVINEDWLALFLAFAVILLSSLGILGQKGLNISF